MNELAVIHRQDSLMPWAEKAAGDGNRPLRFAVAGADVATP